MANELRSASEVHDHESALKLMKLLRDYKGSDVEVSHQIADDVLCRLLEILGYNDIVAVYRDVEKWYA